MKLMISDDQYKRSMNKLVYRLPIELLVIGFVVILIVQILQRLLTSGLGGETIAEVAASSFFYGTMLTAIVYFIKGRRFAGTFETDPQTTVKGEIDYYLPCIEGSSLKGGKAGFLLIKENEMIFVHKKVDGFVEEKAIKDLSAVNISAEIDGFNPYSFLLYGFRDVMIVESDQVKYKFNMYEAEKVAKEVQDLLIEIQKVMYHVMIEGKDMKRDQGTTVVLFLGLFLLIA